MTEHPIGYKDILKQKEYMKTVIAGIINRFGDSIDSIAFVWLVYQVTRSAAWSVIIFGVNRIPTIFLQPFAGAAIEGMNKKTIMIITDILRGLCVGFVATALVLGFLNQWILLAATVVISCAEAFRGPASASLLPKLLDKKYYSFGISLSTSANSITELIGVGVAGVIIAVFSVSTAIYIDMATFFASALIILTLRIHKEVKIKVPVNVKEYAAKLKGGFSYLNKKAVLKYFVILSVFLNGVLVPFNSLQAPLVGEVLHTGEVMLSVLGIAFSLGMITGAGAYPYLSSFLNHKIFVLAGVYSIGLYYFLLVFLAKFVESVVLLYIIIAAASFIVGITISIMSTYANTEFMKNIEEEYLARVSALLNSGAMAAIPIVSFFVSLLAERVSTVVLFMIAGAFDFIIGLCLCSRKKLSVISQVDREDTFDVRESENYSTGEPVK
ncbi:MAG: MFS transporter [Mobilitalea sp.]